MFHLLLLEVVVCAALILLAGLVGVGRWRRRRSRRLMPARERRRAVAEPPSEGLAAHPVTVVPGFHGEARLPYPPPDPGARVPGEPPAEPHVGGVSPAEPERAAGPHVGAVAEREPGRAAGPHVGAVAEREPGRAAESDVSEVAGPEPHLNGPAGRPDEQLAAAGAVPGNERISRYYEDADKPISDYLSELGWTGDPGAHDPWTLDPGTSG